MWKQNINYTFRIVNFDFSNFFPVQYLIFRFQIASKTHQKNKIVNNFDRFEVKIFKKFNFSCIPTLNELVLCVFNCFSYQILFDFRNFLVKNLNSFRNKIRLCANISNSKRMLYVLV